jgi:acetyl esterase
VDDGVAAVLAQMNAGFPAVETMTAAQARAAVAARRPPVTNVDDVASAVDRVVVTAAGAIPVRIYRPHGAAETLPAIVFYHGGGFVLCGLDSHDGFCRALSRYTQSVVVSVDYRLAPEHPAPAAAEDAFAAYCWTETNADELGVESVAVAGDSAGGNLAAAAALMCRERGVPMPVAQVLLYPMLDPACDGQSHITRATGYQTTSAHIRWYWRLYLGGDELPEPAYLTAPVRADSLAGLPPAVVITAGLDPLHDEGVAYARALRAAGVPLVHRDYPGLFHGFVTLMALPFGASARELLWVDVREAFANSRESV